jgi:hypothetical protein
MESEPSQSAQERLDSLAASRELVLGRIALPWGYVIGGAIVGNACMIALVLPIVISEGWTLLVQSSFLAAGLGLLLRNRADQRVKRPRLRLQGSWMLTVVTTIGLGSALAVGIYARSKDDPGLGAAALLINFAAYMVVYGGLGFLLRRQVARLT